MLRRQIILAGLVLIASACGRAHSNSTGIHAIEDPNLFAETLARRIASEGMAPIRQTFAEFGQVNVDPAAVEGALTVFERSLQGKQSSHWNEIEDVELRDQFRSIYYLHVFDSRTYLYTRQDFARTGPRTWSLVGLTFGGQWINVVLPTTPSFSSQS